MRNGFVWFSAAIVVLFAMPYVGNAECRWTNGLYECICILALFPLIVSAGAGSSAVKGRQAAICKFLGEISYPLYITHYPLIYMHVAWVNAHPDVPTGTHAVVCGAIFIIAIANAYACMKLIDIPVRKWLTERFLNK